MNLTKDGQFTWHGLKRISDEDFRGREDFTLLPGDVLFNNTNSKELVGKTCYIDEQIHGGYSNHITRIRVDGERCISGFLAHVLHAAWRKGVFLEQANKWIGQAGINTKSLSGFLIPLPPLEVQQKIVSEIEGYQKVIDGARAVVENYRPHIHIDPDWPMVALGKVCQINPKKANPTELYPDSYFNYIDISCVENGTGRFLGATRVETSDAPSRARRLVESGDVLISTVRPNLRAFTKMSHLPDRSIASTGFAVLRPTRKLLLPNFLINIMRNDSVVDQMIGMMGRGAYPSINQTDVASLQIPLPPLEVQKVIVADIDAEQAIIEANRDLIKRFKQKIRAAIARVWNHEPMKDSHL